MQRIIRSRGWQDQPSARRSSDYDHWSPLDTGLRLTVSTLRGGAWRAQPNHTLVREGYPSDGPNPQIGFRLTIGSQRVRQKKKIRMQLTYSFTCMRVIRGNDQELCTRAWESEDQSNIDLGLRLISKNLEDNNTCNSNST